MAVWHEVALGWLWCRLDCGSWGAVAAPPVSLLVAVGELESRAGAVAVESRRLPVRVGGLGLFGIPKLDIEPVGVEVDVVVGYLVLALDLGGEIVVRLGRFGWRRVAASDPLLLAFELSVG